MSRRRKVSGLPVAHRQIPALGAVFSSRKPEATPEDFRAIGRDWTSSIAHHLDSGLESGLDATR